MMLQSDPVFLAFTLAILIFSIIVHEVAHGYAANALGDPTARLAGRLTLNPIPHIDLIGSVLVPVFLVISNAGILFGWAKPVPYNPYNLKSQRWGEAIVAFAGPGTNILLAVIFGLLVRFGTGLPVPFLSLATIAAYVNLFLGLFNLIPIPPLDGYTTLRGLLPYKAAMPLRNLEARIQQGGFVSLILILMVFSLFFAGPFALLVQYLFTLLIG
jgi:Zn-dependent protease